MYLILAAHGQLASAVKQSAEMVFGQMEKMTTVEFVPGENAEDLKRKYQEAIENAGNDEILFLVDLFGGSPYNAAFETALQKENMDVITGLSLPMLIDVIGVRTMEPELKAKEYIKSLGKESYIKALSEMTTVVEEEEDEL